MSRLTFIDLCCGGGGVTDGFKRNPRFEHCLGVDIEKNCRETYEANHGPGSFMLADVSCEDVSTRILAAVKARKPHVNSIDVTHSSFSCKDFSIGKLTNPDITSALDVIRCTIRIARKIGCRFFTQENVPNMVNKKTRDGVSAVDQIVADLRAAGFVHVETGVFNCADYGVYQDRRRLLIVAARSHADAGVLNEMRARASPTRGVLGDVLEDLNTIIHTMDNELGKTMKDHAAYNVFMQEDKITYYLTRTDKNGVKHARFLDPAKLAPTLIAGYHKSRGQQMLVMFDVFDRITLDPQECVTMRMLTIRECARLQGFLDTYIWFGACGPVSTMIGNAVPPPFMACLADSIEAVVDKQKKPIRRLVRLVRHEAASAAPASPEGCSIELEDDISAMQAPSKRQKRIDDDDDSCEDTETDLDLDLDEVRNEYECERAENIARIRAKLASLGVQAAARAITSVAKNRKNKDARQSTCSSDSSQSNAPSTSSNISDISSSSTYSRTIDGKYSAEQYDRWLQRMLAKLDTTARNVFPGARTAFLPTKWLYSLCTREGFIRGPYASDVCGKVAKMMTAALAARGDVRMVLAADVPEADKRRINEFNNAGARRSSPWRATEFYAIDFE